MTSGFYSAADSRHPPMLVFPAPHSPPEATMLLSLLVAAIVAFMVWTAFKDQ